MIIQLHYDRELRTVLATVRGARVGDAQVHVVPFASTTAIRTALVPEAAHVLHLSGHEQPGTLAACYTDAPAEADAVSFVARLMACRQVCQRQ